MSWDFSAGGIATTPSTTSPAAWSFWAWVKPNQGGPPASPQRIFRDNGGRLDIYLTQGSGGDVISVERSGMTGSIACDLSDNGIANNGWYFFGVAMSGFTTLDRFVLGDEDTAAFEATLVGGSGLTGTGFTAAANKSLGNSSADTSRFLRGLIHSAGFYQTALSLAQFETARTTFNQSAGTPFWTFLLNDPSDPFSVAAQSGSGDLTATGVTYSDDAPFYVPPAPSSGSNLGLTGVG